MAYVPPEFQKPGFTCPHCTAFSQMVWMILQRRRGTGLEDSGVSTARCAQCGERSIWQHRTAAMGSMIWPDAATAPAPHPQMPGDIKADYLEARQIAGRSPRGAAALLRLAIDKLCAQLLGNDAGAAVNDNIGTLVARGLPVEIQQALDVVRVVGNKAVHPGELSADDIAAVADRLFELVNAIVEDRIARPARFKELYAIIPDKALAGIQQRDSKQQG